MANQIPKDAHLFRYGGEGGTLWVIYLVEGQHIAYKLTDPSQYDTSGMQIFDRAYGSPEDQNKEFPDVVNAGEASELHEVATTYGTFGGYWQHIVNAYMGSNPAKDDPEVRKVLAQVAARPDMGQGELEGLLKQTSWFKARTEAELAWNDLSPAEQTTRVNEQAARLADMWLQEVGGPIDLTNPQIQHFAQQIASGKMGTGQVLQTWIRGEASKNPESPWSRTIRNEQENQRARGVDVENSTSAVRQTAAKWGIQMSDQSLSDWGSKLVTKEASEADLETHLKQQAKILYAWKDENVPTMDAAQPWLQTYSRVLEKGATDLFNPLVQEALQQGQPLYEFEKSLKARPEWLETGNARETLSSMAGDVGRRFGFE